MKHFLLVLGVLSTLIGWNQSDKPAYLIFDGDGKEVKYSKMMKDLNSAKVILFGEFHDNPISHWLQFEMTVDLFNSKRSNLVLGAEMFEADNQLIIDEYFKDQISDKSFQAECRLWPNYNTDYKPIFEFAKDQKIPFIATNVPRRYASMVYKKGMESLYSIDSSAREYVAPLPIEVDTTLSQYQSLMHSMGGHGGVNFVTAQAIKDATMAHFILKNMDEKSVFLHFNGAYHSDYKQGITHYLKKSITASNIKTITTVTQDDISELSEENRKKADFIIVVPTSMTRTH
ncbi:MAG: ChaN family lipoprotein [Crocinitomicaceae bacterium]|nr:ChaN family lipoprotein [Crocinitomicaceae bacterium]